MKKLLIVLGLFLCSCTTSQVTETCQETNAIVSSPLADLAPGEVKLAVLALRGGSYICGTPAYAAFRERVMVWWRSKWN